MKPILNIEKFPKFLIVNEIAEKKSYNGHLLKPYKKGEIVKVAPFNEQVRNDKYDADFKYAHNILSPEQFRKHYVVVYRKDDSGKFNLKHTSDWKNFDLLTKIKK